jgi:hypothetical protein
MAEAGLRKVLATVAEWFTREATLRDARGRLPAAGGTADRAYRQAQLLLEVARRTSEPVEPLPDGSRPAVLLPLYRDAAYWALVAERPADGPPPADLQTLWERVPLERRQQAAGGPSMLAAARRALLEVSPGSIDVRDEDVFSARTFAENVYRDLETPRRQTDRILAGRWLRIGGAAAVLIALGVWARERTIGPNLAEGKAFRTSSSWSGCSGDAGCRELLFHTDPQKEPWVEFDLGAPIKIRRIEVTNRPDCCTDRATPLIAEVSRDRVSWAEVAKKDEPFATWTSTFRPTIARYLRLRVTKETALHLKEVVIR